MIAGETKPTQIVKHKSKVQSSTAQADFRFTAKLHHKQPEIFNHSLCHMSTGNQEHRNNSMFPFVPLRSCPSAVPRGFVTARIDPLRHHSVLTNNIKLALSGNMHSSENSTI